MSPIIADVKVLGGYRLWLRFHDGASGIVDLSAEMWGPMFEPLKDQALFAQVTVNSELPTVTWPNGADLSPEFLYCQAAEPGAAAAPPQAAGRQALC